MAKIFVSLMAADQLNIEHEIKKFEVHCDGFHVDVMDNHFVPNLTFGITAVNQMAQITNKPLVLHLMVNKPEAIINHFNLRKNSTIAFHVNSTTNVEAMIEKIKAKELAVSLALSPSVSVQKVLNYLPLVQQVLVMGVEPGFSGQEFIPDMIKKVEMLSLIKKAKNLSFSIAFDGGVDAKTIVPLSAKGVTHFGVGSAIFDEEDPIEAIEQLYDAVSAE